MELTLLLNMVENSLNVRSKTMFTTQTVFLKFVFVNDACRINEPKLDKAQS